MSPKLRPPRGTGDSDLAADLDDIETAPVRLPDGRVVQASEVPDLADELGDEDDEEPGAV